MKIKVCSTAICVLLLASCVKTNELYDRGQYIDGADFTKIFYTDHDPLSSLSISKESSVSLDASQYCNGTRGLSTKTNKTGSIDFTPMQMSVSVSQTKALDGTLSLDVTIPKLNPYESNLPVSILLGKTYEGKYAISSSKGADFNVQSYSFEVTDDDVVDVTMDGAKFTFSPSKIGETTLTLKANVTVSGTDFELQTSIQFTFANPYGTRAGYSERYPEVFSYQGSYLSADPSDDWNLSYAKTNNDSSFIGKSFGRSKCLATTDESFKSGYLSKIYDGQMYCEGYHSRALVALDQNGYSAFFPKTLDTGDYFLMSFRGGSNDDTGSNHNAGSPRISSFDLSLDFYYRDSEGYRKVTVVSDDVIVETDNGGEGCTFFGFKFSEIGVDPKGILGMGLRYNDFQDPQYAFASEETCNQKEPKQYSWGLLVYELMFPDSTWK